MEIGVVWDVGCMAIPEVAEEVAAAAGGRATVA